MYSRVVGRGRSRNGSRRKDRKNRAGVGRLAGQEILAGAPPCEGNGEQSKRRTYLRKDVERKMGILDAEAEAEIQIKLGTTKMQCDAGAWW